MIFLMRVGKFQAAEVLLLCSFQILTVEPLLRQGWNRVWNSQVLFILFVSTPLQIFFTHSMRLRRVPLRGNLLRSFRENASHMVFISCWSHLPSMSCRCHDAIRRSQQQLTVTVHHGRTPLRWRCLDLSIQIFTSTSLTGLKLLSLKEMCVTSRKTIQAPLGACTCSGMGRKFQHICCTNSDTAHLLVISGHI